MITLRSLITAIVLLLHWASSAAAKSTPPPFPKGLSKCGYGIASDIFSGDRFRLKDGTSVSLADIKAPEFWPEGAPYKSWPYGQIAKQALTKAIGSEPLQMFCKSKRKNHLGDIVAHIKTTQGSWLQYEMVQNGHAYFMPRYQRPSDEGALRNAETTAQQNKKGLWAIQGFNVIPASSPDIRPGWFQVISGLVISEKRHKSRTFLNFGTDWSKDFTIEIPSRLYRQFAYRSDTSLGLQGKHIEVRGWVEWSGGPKIILEDAAQLYTYSPEPDQSR